MSPQTSFTLNLGAALFTLALILLYLGVRRLYRIVPAFTILIASELLQRIVYPLVAGRLETVPLRVGLAALDLVQLAALAFTAIEISGLVRRQR